MEGLKKSFLVRGSSIVGFSDKNFSTLHIGCVIPFAGNTDKIPRGYLLANGASYKVADYPDLYAVIGNTYGGDTENFNVPTVQPSDLTMVYIIKAFHTNEGVDSKNEVSDPIIEYVEGKVDGLISDTTSSATSTWSSSKIASEIGNNISIETDQTITFSNDYTKISMRRGGYNNIRAHIEIDALCNIISINGWIQDMGIVLPEGYRPSYETAISAWGSSDTEYHIPIILMLGANGKFSGYIGGSHKSITQLHIAVTYLK